MENKCEKLGIAHAWRSSNEMYGFSIVQKEKCANCELVRQKNYSSREWYSYSDGRPDEEIITVRPV